MLPETPDEIAPGRGTVALRVPGLALPRLLAAPLGRPISGVSANLHDQPPCHEAREVAQLFPDDVALVLDGGRAPGKKPSSILDLTGGQPKLLREGAIGAGELERFLH
jgi:L-threonylcarbamoyladenylate synthase